MVWPEFFWVRPESSLLALLGLGFFSMFFGFLPGIRGLLLVESLKWVKYELLQLFLTLLWGSILLGEVVTLDVWIFASLVALTVYVGRACLALNCRRIRGVLDYRYRCW